MARSNEIPFLRKNLLGWFNQNRREFPWRKPNVSNYELIISEILLQRTRAETVSKYYETYFSKFPNWKALCLATIEQLEQILLPLGLYRRRAQRLFAIAREYEKRQGRLPQSKIELQESNLGALYIRNAFELFILKKRSPLLDVNMARVLERYFNARESTEIRLNKELQELAKMVINVRDCKELNYAFLDFAALTCKSQKPKCLECPLSSKCRYFAFYKKIGNAIL